MTIAPSIQKLRGAYYTPEPLAQALVRWAVRTSTDRVLDPACGDAVFLEAAVARLTELGAEVANARIEGVELDQETAVVASSRVPAASVIQMDFFHYATAEQEFDAVVGNPPYIRYHHFSGLDREVALASSRELGVELSQLTSSWAPFLVSAASCVVPNGRLAFVLPAELLTTDYARPVREFLRRRFRNVDVVTFEHRIFPGAMVDAVVLLASGVGPGEVNLHRLSQVSDLERLSETTSATSQSSDAKWTAGLLDALHLEAYESARANALTLGTIATVDIGMVTGANGFFVMSEPERRSRRIRKSQVVPILARGQQMGGVSLPIANWNQLCRDGEKVWLFAPEKPNAQERTYIGEGERLGFHQGYKCRIRDPWWRVKTLPAPDLILTYMSHRAPRLVANEAGVRTTNLLHNVRLRSPSEATHSARCLATAWHNSLTMLSCELEGRAYGGGVLKLETKEAERVVVPRLTATARAELLKHSDSIGRLLKDGLLEAAMDMIDPIVLGQLSVVQRSRLRDGWLDLKHRRLGRNGSQTNKTRARDSK